MTFDLTTFAFEIINFAVLVWILRRIVYIPLRRGIESRRKTLDEERAEASRQRNEAELLRNEAETRLAEIEQVRAKMVSEGREQAAAESARILNQAREDAAAERERVQHLLGQEREAALSWVRDATLDGCLDLTGRLLLELAPDAVEHALATRLAEEVRVRRDTLRSDLAGETRDGKVPEVQLTVAHALRDQTLDQLRSAIENALGSACDFSVREDESLVAGMVLRIANRVLDASIAGELSALRERAQALLEVRESGG